MVGINRQYKDTMFRYLFSDPKNFAELYGAITGTTIDAKDLTSYDLESMFISDWRNDVSFMTRDKSVIILVEHQSTDCANMAIRCLVYYADLVKRIYAKERGFKNKIYRDKPLPLPKPEFYVLRMGGGFSLQRQRLSQHFINSERIDCEVSVKVLNIDYKFLKYLSGKSEVLEGYSYFVQQYQEYIKTEEEVDALRLAVGACKSKGYLLDYLDRREFLIVAQEDFTVNDLVNLKYEEGIEKGIEKGIEEGKTTERARLAQKFSKKGIDLKVIADILGVTQEEVQELLKYKSEE